MNNWTFQESHLGRLAVVDKAKAERDAEEKEIAVDHHLASCSRDVVGSEDECHGVGELKHSTLFILGRG